MPSSMTGFGQASFADHELSADVIVRCVNGKHLKTKVTLGINLPIISDRIAALIARHMTRGTVDVAVRLDWTGAGTMAFNERIIASYARQLDRLRRRLGLAAEIQVDRIAALPGAMVTDGLSSRAANHIWRKLQPIAEEALSRAARMRAAEGRILTAELRRGAARMSALLARIEARLPKAVLAYRQRLTQRVRTLLDSAGTPLEPGSLARELILHSERTDITEELSRMHAHITHFRQTLTEPGTGRKLEFIAQEMHREANTMASKASDPQMTELIIDLRGEVDKIREQVLNLE